LPEIVGNPRSAATFQAAYATATNMGAASSAGSAEEYFALYAAPRAFKRAERRRR